MRILRIAIRAICYMLVTTVFFAAVYHPVKAAMEIIPGWVIASIPISIAVFICVFGAICDEDNRPNKS